MLPPHFPLFFTLQAGENNFYAGTAETINFVALLAGL